jgi:Zn-dependent peptidase ImmA (M78 family)
MEEEADHFAAALLLPAEVMRELVTKHTVRCGGRRAILVRLMAAECLVSAAAMSRRLDYLKLGQLEDNAEVRT